MRVTNHQQNSYQEERSLPRKALNAIISYAFHAKMPPSFNKAAATTASTQISLAATGLTVASSSFSSLLVVSKDCFQFSLCALYQI